MIPVRGATVLVACSAQKLEEPAEARDLYASPWFKKARAVAERGDRWFILSAAYGLVGPRERLAPYDVALTDFRGIEREEWSREVSVQIVARAPVGRIVMLASSLYCSKVVPRLLAAGYLVERPLAGLGIGQQLHLLAQGAA